MGELARRLCYQAQIESDQELPLFALSLPDVTCDYDALLEDILEIIDEGTNGSQRKYRLLIFCAAGQHRPSWPWLIQSFSTIDKKYKKALQRLYLVHEKAWVRVCMQLLENVVSPKFARKVKHVKSLNDLQTLLGSTMSSISIPPEVIEYDNAVVQATSTNRSSRTDEKRSRNPPAVPTPRIAQRTTQSPAKSKSLHFDPQGLPNIPPRRNANKTSKHGDAYDCIIFEDPVNEEAADLATANLEALLGNAAQTKTSQRSTSAPSIIQEDFLRRAKPRPQGQKNAAPAALRRAISGPLTPSSAVKQNFIPTNPTMPPPKIKIHGKEVTIKTRTAKMTTSESKVGGLAALFEERALVAKSLR